LYLKSYLFLTLAVILRSMKIDLTKPLVNALTIIAVLTVLIAIIGAFSTSLFWRIHEVGFRYDIFCLGGARLYGGNIFPRIAAVYFYTSEMMVLPLGYFTVKTFFSNEGKKLQYGLLLMITIFAMFISTTRNNILAAILLPFMVAFWYSKRKKIIFGLLIVLFLYSIFNLDLIISTFFDSSSPSNAWKMQFVKDYANLLNDDRVFLFGQGMGSFFKTKNRGYVSVTELTYFEFIRQFGVLLFIPMLVLLFYPLTKLFSRRYERSHYLFIAYLFILGMTFFNPLLMSSSGMLLLSVVLFKTFPPSEDVSFIEKKRGAESLAEPEALA
ncbi:MAG: hypothetical protein AB1650_01540, partial [Candidatus Omnitrophota bacterium]